MGRIHIVYQKQIPNFSFASIVQSQIICGDQYFNTKQEADFRINTRRFYNNKLRRMCSRLINVRKNLKTWKLYIIKN